MEEYVTDKANETKVQNGIIEKPNATEKNIDKARELRKLLKEQNGELDAILAEGKAKGFTEKELEDILNKAVRGLDDGKKVEPEPSRPDDEGR